MHLLQLSDMLRIPCQTSQFCFHLQMTYDILCHCSQSIAGNTGHCIAHCIHADKCIYFNSRIFCAFRARRHTFVLIFKGPMTFSAAACSQSPVTPAIVLRIACYWLADSIPTVAFLCVAELTSQICSQLQRTYDILC